LLDNNLPQTPYNYNKKMKLFIIFFE